jgi:hypothetical protein
MGLLIKLCLAIALVYTVDGKFIVLYRQNVKCFLNLKVPSDFLEVFFIAFSAATAPPRPCFAEQFKQMFLIFRPVLSTVFKLDNYM